MSEITVVIPTVGSVERTRCAVEGLRQHQGWPDYWVLIVDTGDGQAANWAMQNGCAVVKLPGGTFSQANNALRQYDPDDWLLLLNDDTIPDRHLVVSLYRAAMDEGRPCIVGARLLYPNGLIQHAGIGFDTEGNPYNLWHLAPGEQPEALKRRWLPAVTFACALIHQEVWHDLSGLDCSYQNGYEDVDFCLRAREAGVPVIYEPTARAIHLAAQSPGRFEHEPANRQRFGERWLQSGRLNYVTGRWPFSKKQKG